MNIEVETGSSREAYGKLPFPINLKGGIGKRELRNLN